MILPIIKYPNEILRQKAKEVENPKSREIASLVLDMLETMEKNDNALGLAATQVGALVRLCIIKFNGKIYVLINPKIKSKSWKKEVKEEGCLSFPGKFIFIKRPKKITVEALDKNGNKIIIKAEGLLARAFFHEIDHLDGILFIDRI
jgi:peptide deformylase